jgi:hypothetical protein
MKKNIAILLSLCAASSAFAADTFRLKDQSGADVVVIVLHESACTDKDVLAYLHDNVFDDRRFKKAHLEWDKQTFGACWIELHGDVHTVGSDRRPLQPLPRSAFKDEGA